MERTLAEQLENYTGTDVYPFHMPGHKRRMLSFPDVYGIDITEIDGFDNLHHAEGILKEAQSRAAELYRAKKAWYLINGSTCGILAAISAAFPKGSRVLVARNCHKAVYHALYLRGLIPVYLYPEITACGLQGQITTETVEKAIRDNPQVKGLILTSPTYDGVLSDISGIAGRIHEAGMTLVVDQAHGAHFGLSPEMPQSAGACGADLVIVSVHKTLPAFTQTALLLSYSERVEETRIAEFLDIYETSSPSYLLMAGIDRCIAIMREQGRELCAELRANLDRFYAQVKGLKRLGVLTREDFTGREAWDFDDSKILILTKDAGIGGAELADLLRGHYHLEPEMTADSYVLALASVMDTEEGFQRLAQALLDIDRALAARQPAESGSEEAGESNPRIQAILTPGECYVPRKRRMEIHEALDLPWEETAPVSAEGKICGGYIYLYPPGIPLIVPGEEVDGTLIRQLFLAKEAGLEIVGMTEGFRTVREYD